MPYFWLNRYGLFLEGGFREWKHENRCYVGGYKFLNYRIRPRKIDSEKSVTFEKHNAQRGFYILFHEYFK